MEFLLENILNLVGFLVGLAIGLMSYIGFRNTGSPTLFRLTIAFVSISLGFFVIWSGYMVEDFIIKSGSIERWIQTVGIVIQTVGYFFIAFSHSIKSFFPKSNYFRSVGILPFFLVSTVQLEHIFRSVSFILLVYGAIETMLSYRDNKNKGAISVALGIGAFSIWRIFGMVFFCISRINSIYNINDNQNCRINCIVHSS